MKILNLIIYNESPHYSKMKEIQKEHMKKYSNVTFYFIEYKKIYPRFEIEENTLTINGVESRMGILQKTIDTL